MNVLMISDVYFPRINGVSTSIETFRRALCAQGVRSTLIAPDYPEAAACRADGSVIRIPSLPVPLDPEDRLMRRRHVRAAMPRLHRERYDLVHIHTPFVAHYAGLEIARALDLPCVATYHTFFEEYLFHYVPGVPRAWLRALARRFSRTQCNELDAVFVPSRAMGETLERYGVTRPLHVLPTGVPPDQFEGGDSYHFRQRYGIERDRKLLLFVGRVAHEKNIGFLIDVLERVRRREPSALLLITGEGPALAALRAQAERAGVAEHVRFLGYLDRHSELHDCYRAADLFVFASRTETQGLVLLEAMALGTPVVALAEMGTRDLLEAQRGCRIAPDDVEGFARIVCGLLGDPRELERLGSEASAYARGWGADEMARRLARLYAGVCASVRRPAMAQPSATPSRPTSPP